MHSKLAGHLPLQDLIQSTINSARTKLAAAEEKEKVKKLVEYEKKEHGGKIPSVKEEEEEMKEKKSSIIDATDAGEVEKLASALEFLGDEFLKEADSIENGGESHQGGEQLPTGSPVGGTQPYKKDGSKKHQVPMSTGMESKKETGSAATAVPDTQHKPPVPLNSAYPTKGVLKTAAEAVKEMIAKKKGEEKKEEKAEEKKEKASSVARLEAALESVAGVSKGKEASAVGETATKAVNATKEYLKKRPDAYREAGRVFKEAVTGKGSIGDGVMTMKDRGLAALHGLKQIAPEAGTAAALGTGAAAYKMKKSSAVNFVLGKIAEYHGGGETLDSASEQGPKPESGGSNSARSNISSIQAAINMKKVDGKNPQKKQLSEVLTEPALTKSTDSKVQENLRNATAGGVKIAAAKAVLAKIAADPSDPRHEALKAAIAKKKEEKEEKSEKKKESGYETPTPTPNPM